MLRIEGTELKPCPLCGSTAGLFKDPGKIWSPAFSVKCLNYHCLCSVQGRTEEEAAEKWNRRVVSEGAESGE